MQFVVTGYDGKDPEAPARRQAAREAHLAQAEKLYGEGGLLYAAALLDEQGGMAGSVLIMSFESEKALREQWLKDEPYVTGDVWRDIRIEPCKVPGFCPQ